MGGFVDIRLGCDRYRGFNTRKWVECWCFRLEDKAGRGGGARPSRAGSKGIDAGEMSRTARGLRMPYKGLVWEYHLFTAVKSHPVLRDARAFT